MAKAAKTPLDPVVQTVIQYREQAAEAKERRMKLNADNFDCYHLKQDWSHKKKGQSKEFLAKQSIAVEQLVSFLSQGLIDTTSWFSVEKEPGVVERNITSSDMAALLKRQLEKNNIHALIADAIKLGALQSLMIVKVVGRWVPKKDFLAGRELQPDGSEKATLKRREKLVWQLSLELVRAEDYYPDPTGEKLYECQEIEMDLHTLVEIAKANPKDYDLAAVEKLQESFSQEQKYRRTRETNQNAEIEGTPRKRVTVVECWGTILDSNGDVIMKDAVCAIANEKFLIRKPQPNPFWHGMSPFIAAPIIRVPKSVWHKAMMDAPTKHNRALNEIYNLQLDAGLQSVFGVRQIREHWLDDPSQVSEGIPPGVTLRANAACPPGQKVLERVDTGTLTSESAAMYQVTDKEFQTSALTNDFRSGNMPDRATKATEVVAANQAITGVFSGIIKAIESDFMSRLLANAWLTSAQHMNDMDEDDVKALLGEQKAMLIAQMTPEERFAETAAGRRFKVFGLSMTLNKINDFRKITALLQTIAGSEALMALFAQRYDMAKFLGEIMKSLDIDEKKIALAGADLAAGPADAAAGANQQAILAQILGAAAPGRGSPDMQSQVPNMAGRPVETGIPVPNQANMGGLTTPGGF